MVKPIPCLLLSGLLLAPGSAPVSYGQETLDLPAAIQQALNHNRELVRSAQLLKNSELDIQSARDDFALRIRPDGNAGVSDGSDTWQYGVVSTKKFLPGTELEAAGLMSRTVTGEDENDRRASIRIEIRQPLFRNLGQLVQGEPIVRAQQGLRTARRNYEQQKIDLVVEVVQAFEQILQLQRQIESDEAFFNRINKLYRLTQARERQGRTTRVDSLRVELQRGQAQSRLENNREQLASAQREFAELLGYDPSHTFALEEPPRFEFDIPTSEEALHIALQNRLDYAQVLQDYDDTQRGVLLANRDLYPDLDVVTRYERFGTGSDFGDSTDLSENGWFLGLSANTDFNYKKQRTGLSQAVVSEDAALQTIRIQELIIAREVQQQLSAYRRAQVDAGIATRNFTLADNRARLARRLFELGRGDNFTVTDAEDAFTQAQSQMLVAVAEASVSTYRVMRSLGTLVDIPSDLKPAGEEVPL